MIFTLVATAKNEGPYLFEWVAHHRMIGFDHILMFQNDSDDLTHETLRLLHDMGEVEYRYNRAAPGKHQVRAYKRAARQDAYQGADWVMALDLDEFLQISAGDGRLPDLAAALPAADEVLVNWRRFGNGGCLDLTGDLVTERFLQAEYRDRITTHLTPYKALFRPGLWERPGIHRPSGLRGEEAQVRVCNGSGLMLGDFERRGFRCLDPERSRLAQVNHYIVRDAASFVLKSHRGSAHQSDRGIDKSYWRRRNFNDERDDRLAQRSAALTEYMAEMDARSDGRLARLRHDAIVLHQERFQALLQQDVYRDLYAFCCDPNSAAPPNFA